MCFVLIKLHIFLSFYLNEKFEKYITFKWQQKHQMHKNKIDSTR
jgi:hypothetical protein